MSSGNRFVICKICGEKLEYKENWGKEHIQKYNHKDFRVVDIV